MGASKVAVEGSSDKTTAGTRFDASVWIAPLAVTMIAVAILVVLFYDTFHSIVAIWSRSDTFAHGFLILPISLYLIWDERDRLVDLVPQPSYRALPFLVLVGLGWLGCRLAGVLVMEQYLAVAAIPLVVWAVLGTSVTRVLAFPLGFLLLGVPVGEALIPSLIDFTAAFTVAGLRLTGVPVLQEGNFLTLANSRWSVVEACSGLRYLIALITLGVLYAHLTYRSWRRRLLCVLAATIVPIIANGFRAYMIVMLGYLSNMTIAVGIDHLIYGWIFFGVVVLLFFWVGSFFREDEADRVERRSVETAPAGGSGVARFALAGTVAIIVAAVWPAWANRVEAYEVGPAASSPLPETVGEWSRSTPRAWEPHYVEADFEATHWYARAQGDEWVGVHTACYAVQRQGAELVNSSNVLVSSDDPTWRHLETREGGASLETGPLDVIEASLDARGPKLLVWSWYRVEGTSTVSPYRAKLIEMTGKLAGAPPLACGITVSTPDSPDSDAARSRLTDYLNAALPAIESGLASLPRAD